MNPRKPHTSLKPLALAFGLLLIAVGATRAAETYLIVDLSGGTNAVSYPVSTLSDVPAGGWTDEHKTDKLVLRKIPAGTFTMGSPTGELGRVADEAQHVVTLTKDFYIGVFEVTQRQWELVMGNKPSYFNNATYYATRPVEWVSYYDIRENPNNTDDPIVNWPSNSMVNAASFMGKLRAKTGLSTFDLPTESQWEYACRAGTATALSSGSNLTSLTACPNMSVLGRYWYNGGSGYSAGCATNAGSAAVGTYAPNPWGLYDMHGNVFELCLDWREVYPGTVIDPVGAETGVRRQIRGGYWGGGPQECRSAYRHPTGDYPTGRGYFDGFRVAQTLSTSAADTDLDGLPDAWESEHFGNLTASDGTGDFDRDGRTDAEELADNTDPVNAGSTLGLVAYYPFNGDALDCSTNGVDASLAGSPAFGIDRFGNNTCACLFDGTDDYVNAPALLNLGQIEYTINLWFRTDPAKLGQTLLDANPHYGFAVTYNDPNNGDSSFVLWVGNGSNWQQSPTLGSAQRFTDQSWHMLSYRKQVDKFVVLIDGIPEITNSVSSAVWNKNVGIRFGKMTYTGTWYDQFMFKGAMDDIRIYNRALSSNEVARLYGAEPQPTTHTVTLHPGDHGDIPGANSGADYVTNVTHGAVFTPPMPNPDAGWSFTDWNPAIPATITNDVTATAVYEAVLTSTYQLIEGSFTWHQAKAGAEARGGRLACFPTSNRWFDCVAQCSPRIFTQGEYWWIGATDERIEGVWEWVSGEAWSFSAWNAGEPNNGGGVEHYAHVQYFPSVRPDLTWNDGDAPTPDRGYILETLSTIRPPVPHPDLSLSASDFRILNAAGVETANPAIGERVTLEVTLRNTGAANTAGDILVQAFLDGAPTNLTSYSTNAYSVVASTVVAESMSVDGSRTILLPWTVTGPDRMATLTLVAEFAANRAQSQANAEGASAALPVAEASLANNATGRPLQLGSPAAGDFGIEVLTAPPPAMQSGVGYTLAGTARYDWGARAPVLGAAVTVTLSNQTHTARTASPDGAWSVALNGLPAGSYPALVQVFDGRLTGETNLTLTVAGGAPTVDLRILDFGFVNGTYRFDGETGYAVTGTPVVLKALVRNDGNTASGIFTVDFLDSIDSIVSSDTINLAAFSEAWITAPAGWAAQVGVHTLRAVADSAGAVAETDEGNNTRVCTVVGTAALPDLIVTGLAFDPAGPKAGDTVTVTATVRNQGGAAVAASTTFHTAFSHGGTVAIPLPAGLAAGASVTVAATHTFAADGAFTVSALADSEGAVAETAEENNARSATLAVRKALPDLRPWTLRWGWQQVSGLSFSPAQPLAGEAVTVSCDLYNVGTVPLAAGKAFDAVFSVGGVLFATNRVVLAAELAVGGSVRTSAVWSGCAAGVTNFTVTVDAADECEEENETNNGTAAGLTVYPAGAALVAAGLTTSPLQPLPGAAVLLTATVRNDGGAAGGAGATVEFFAGTTNLADRIGVTNLAADAAAKGGTQAASLAWTAPGALGPVTLYARSGGSAAQRVMTVTARPAPNLQVYSEDIVFDPALPTRGATVAVSAAVRNTEGSAATGFQVRFFLDTPLGGWVNLGGPVTVGSLAVGAETTVTATDAILADRSAFGVKVELVPGETQDDADPVDNAATSSFVLAETPVADAGADAACIVGQTVALDGTASRNATAYAWTLVEKPAESDAELTGADTATPGLTPDRPGRYRARLVVGDGLLASEPDTVEITARWLTLEVVSAHGTPVPGVGTHPYPWMTEVACQSMSVESVGLTRHLCAGWTGTGSVPASGATTNTSFAITNDSTIVWNWATEHRLTAETADGQGWLSVTGAWVAAESTVTVAVVADDGWRFERWEMDGEPADAGTTNRIGGTNTITVAMDAPHALTAVFAALDLPEALDNAGLVWTTGGASNWVGQTRETFDGVDAAGSGMVSNNAQSWLETSVTNGGLLTFTWRVSSKELGGLLRFEVDGQTRGLISGETAWQTNSVSVPYGEHTFRWVYAKGKSGAEGADRGWVDQVVWTPLPPLTLAVALDVTNLVWQTEGGATWFPQTEVTADGVAAAQTGPVGDSGWSCLTTRIRGSGVLAFDWRVSCEEDYDWLVLIVDGTVEWAVTGESGWQRVQLALGEGDHELRWKYWKDESVSDGLDAGWLDRVSWSGAVPPQTGFSLWLSSVGLNGDPTALFAQDRNEDGVPNGFEYAFGTNLPSGALLLDIRMANGRPVVETPAQDVATAPYVDVRVLGSTNLLDWNLPVAPAPDTTGKPANRFWHEPEGITPDKVFFKLKAELK